ncbi:hypothetical protein HDU76_013153 [Blyttiomyces sp. JEL0837]|nr:hypothetical protein HDU76_013153 [Blyttiomyces sp. JEL0837]
MSMSVEDMEVVMKDSAGAGNAGDEDEVEEEFEEEDEEERVREVKEREVLMHHRHGKCKTLLRRSLGLE